MLKKAFYITRYVSRETLLVPVHAWRIVSKILPPRCKYYPSCSKYSIDCVRKHGVFNGLLLTFWRIIRCNPWSLGGVDLPPENPPIRRVASWLRSR